MKRFVWILLGCLSPGFIASGEELGRLFFTPAERANLDHLRRLGKPPGKSMKTGAKAGTKAEPGVSVAVSMGGYVKRSDGEATIWVNGQPLQEETSTKDVEVGKLGESNQVRLKLSGSGHVVSLKAGQRYDPVSGKILNDLWGLPMDKNSFLSKPIPMETSEPNARRTK
jgi:hypothetical protein